MHEYIFMSHVLGTESQTGGEGGRIIVSYVLVARHRNPFFFFLAG